MSIESCAAVKSPQVTKNSAVLFHVLKRNVVQNEDQRLLAQQGSELVQGAERPYAFNSSYDHGGNITLRNGWGVANASYTASYSNNRRAGLSYDASGNVTNDGSQTYSYDATGQQATASGNSLSQAYDGDGLRGKKVENGTTTYYLRSSVLSGQVISELNGSGAWMRGYVYLGGQLVAIQSSLAVSTVHQDPVTKSQRITNSAGSVVSTIDVDPWGGELTVAATPPFNLIATPRTTEMRMVATTPRCVVTNRHHRALINQPYLFRRQTKYIGMPVSTIR